jgi:RecA-family ATPase
MAKINSKGGVEEPTQEEKEGLEQGEAFHTLARNSLDLLKCFTEEPVPLDFVLPGFVAGTVGTLFSPGATGKSFLTIQAAMGVACRVASGDILNLQPAASGRVVYIAAEDPATVLNTRLYAIAQHLPPVARESIIENLTIHPVMGRGLDLGNRSHCEGIVNYTENARLIVIDTISRVHTLEENSNSDMSKLLQNLEFIALRTGAAVLFLHHISKGAATSGQGATQQAARGASVLTDNARWGAALTTMSENEAQEWSDDTSLKPIGGEFRKWYVKMSFPKANYGPPLDDWFFKRVEGGVLVPVPLIQVGGKPKPEKSGRGKKAEDVVPDPLATSNRPAAQVIDEEKW